MCSHSTTTAATTATTTTAIFTESREEVRQLLTRIPSNRRYRIKAKAAANLVQRGVPLLSLAVAAGDTRSVQTLIDRKADVDTVSARPDPQHRGSGDPDPKPKPQPQTLTVTPNPNRKPKP